MIPLRTTRRSALRALGIGVAGGALALSVGPAAAAADRVFFGRAVQARAEEVTPVLMELGAQIQDLMRRYGVPGVAAGLRIDGREYASGWGTTNVEYPMPVDSGTVFQVGSTTKTFTGTAAAIFVERGLLDLEGPVRTYVSDLVLADSS